MKDNSLLLYLLKHIHSCPCPVYYVYDIPTDPDRTVEFVEFDYDCRFCLKAFAWLRVDCESTDIRYFTEAPYSWKLNRKVRHLKLIANTLLVPDCLHTSVVYEEPEVWTTLAPNESYPLPPEPSEISKITFEAKTDAGTTSTISLLVDGSVLSSSQVTSSPATFEMSIGATVPVELVELKNTGSSTVYIRNLTTE